MLSNPTGLDVAAIVDPNINRPWTMADKITFTNVTTHGTRFNANVQAQFGTSGESGIYYNGTDLIIDPQLSGAGLVKLGASNDRSIQLNKIGLGTTAVSALNWIAFNQTVSTGRGALSFTLVYTGSGTLLANVASSLTHQGSGATGTIIGFNSSMAKNQDQSGTASYYAYKGTIALSSGQAITQGVSNLYGLHLDNVGVGTGHTGGTARQYGIFINTLGTISGVATYEKWGINTLEDIQVASDKKMIYEGDATTKGDTYHTYNSIASELETWVDGVKVLGATSTTVTAYVGTSGFGGGGGTFKQGTVDFGTSSQPETATVTIADASIAAGSILCLGIAPSSGRDPDEMDMEAFSLAYGNIVAATSVDIYVTNTTGGAEGTYLVNYTRN